MFPAWIRMRRRGSLQPTCQLTVISDTAHKQVLYLHKVARVYMVQDVFHQTSDRHVPEIDDEYFFLRSP